MIGVGKIYDIFDGEGITEKLRTKNNAEGIQVMLELADREFEGLPLSIWWTLTWSTATAATFRLRCGRGRV